jgi:hypothetical protein
MIEALGEEIVRSMGLPGAMYLNPKLFKGKECENEIEKNH